MIKLKSFLAILVCIVFMSNAFAKASDNFVSNSGLVEDISTPTTDKILLVKDGKPVSTIVIPDNADYWTAQVAANYVQEYIKKASGAELKITTESNAPQGTLISIGHTNLAKKMGINTEGLKLDSCRLIVRDSILFLIGCDTDGEGPEKRSRGTCKAATTFLQKYIGVQWFIPAPEGEFVPQTNNVSISNNLNETVTTDFAYSAQGPYPCTSPAGVAYNSYKKNKLWTVGGHPWGEWVPVDKYFKEHPEYFALIKGKRSDAKLNFLCPSNPDVRNIIVRKICKLFDQGYDWVQLGQADGMSQLSGMCECPECTRLNGNYHSNALEILKENPCESILAAHKWIVDECKKSHPDKTVHLLVYGPTIMPSKLFDKFGDNVVAELCNTDPSVINAWQGKVRALTAYIYWEWSPGQSLGILPMLTPSSITEQMRYFHKNNIIGIYYCNGHFGKNWGLWGPVYYTGSRLIECPDLNPDDLVKEYCQGIYGECAPMMKIFFDQLYSRIDNIKLAGRLNEDNYIVGADIGTKNCFLLYYPPDFVKKLDKLLTTAEQMAKTEKSKGWLRLTRDSFDYMKTISNMFASYIAYEAKPNSSNLLEVKDCVNDFEMYRERIIAYGNDSNYCEKWFPQYGYYGRYLLNWMDNYAPYKPPKNIRGLPTDYGRIGSPITWDFDKRLKELGQNPDRKMMVPRALTAPKIDGKVDINEWKEVPPQQLGELTGGDAEVSTSFQVMYDDKNLYVSFVCHEPEIEKLKIEELSRDSRIWDYDCVSVLLDSDNSFSKHQHFMVAPADGSFYDAKTSSGKQDLKWDPDWYYSYKLDKEKKIWSIEMAIPFKSMESDSPEPGTTWRANFARERHTGRSSLFLWSPSECGFNDLSTYGELLFSK